MTIADHIVEADRLVKKHGVLPHLAWLLRNGHRGLVACKQAYPGAFAHMVQERKCKSLDERIQEAKRLEKVHGQLPHVGWLVKNGHGAGMDDEKAPTFLRKH